MVININMFTSLVKHSKLVIIIKHINIMVMPNKLIKFIIKVPIIIRLIIIKHPSFIKLFIIITLEDEYL